MWPSPYSGWPLAVGKSKTTVYVTFDKPNFGGPGEANFFPETLLYHAGKHASGLDDPDEIVTKIFKVFESQDVSRTDGTPLGYYKKWTNRNADWRTLVADGDGMCGAWANYFVSILYAQGLKPHVQIQSHVPESKTVMFPANRPALQGQEYFLIGKGDWTFGAANIAGGLVHPNGQTYTHAVEAANGDVLSLFAAAATGTKQLIWASSQKDAMQLPVNGAVTHKSGLKGQNSDPVPLFNNHSQVKVGDTVYDPSYGVTYEDLADFENTAVAGFVTEAMVSELDIKKDLDGDGKFSPVKKVYWFFRQNTNAVDLKLR